MSSRVSSQVVKGGTASSGDIEAEATADEKSIHRSRHIFAKRVRGTIGGFAVLIALYAVKDLAGLVFLVFFCAVPMSIVIKLISQNKHTDFSNFDSIIDSVASKVHSEAEEDRSGESELKTPLLLEAQAGPPLRGVYHIEDRTFGISDKKTGETFLKNSSAQCVVRLTFSEFQAGWLIEGSRACNNSDGFAIKKGFVAAGTKAAYWEEANDQGTRRVVTGQFDASFEAFNGEWLSSNADRGSLNMLETRNFVGIDYAVPVADKAILTPLEASDEAAVV